MVYALRSLGIEVPLSDEQEEAADVNDDGAITVQDAYLILIYYANVSAGNALTWAEVLEIYD